MSFSGILAAEVERAAVLARAKAAAETTRPRKRELVLRVDTREANNDDLMYELRLAYAKAGMADRIQVATLNLFDFEFAVRDTGDEFGPKIERKTPGDLEASVMDGRFAEQKAAPRRTFLPATSTACTTDTPTGITGASRISACRPHPSAGSTRRPSS